ncbi:hypothetical protein AO370_0229 [Moraxella catarrhalis]|uniref:Uncharacterized protein n=1 Tax=Moraxella catarrhalis TaxID=480 RepID=A0AB36DRE7_MORCA|nr:hypothetical protein AO370_0229 [Moraxella catarrhalis]
MPEFWARSKRIFKINQPIRPKINQRCHFNGCNNQKSSMN